MKLLQKLLLVFLLFFAVQLSAQKQSIYRIQLQSGILEPAPNISSGKIKAIDRSLQRTKNRTVLLLQFETMPGKATREKLRQAGIELKEYVSGNAFMAVVGRNLDASQLKRAGVRAAVQLGPSQKMDARLARGQFPSWAQRGAGRVEVWISFSSGFTREEVETELNRAGFQVNSSTLADYRILSLVVNNNDISRLASFPFVEFVQAAPDRDKPLNDKSLVNSRGNVLQSTLPGGRGLTGQGVVVGVGDDGNPTQHSDLSGHVYNHSSASAGPHGVHVMGTIAGAGIRDERFKGYAPQSILVAQLFSNILAYTPAYIADYGMAITNNSYGNVENDCETFGVYDLYSRLVDNQMQDYPFLTHVFAAGNSGNMNCDIFPTSYGTVLGGYQSSKNAIVVGNTLENGAISSNSSRGPVSDGRIKPEITAQGTRVMSTGINNTYVLNSGTSMSAPAVSGGLALLYERYKQLHGGNNPSATLMKALLCNGATDLGNEGPDYTYGFGWMNLMRSVRMLEQTNYFTGQVIQNGSNQHTINIPAGSDITQLKVMLHWSDPAASPLSAQPLQHDLDLRITAPDGSQVLPYILNSDPDKVTQAATRGVDRVNNIEQVVINNPQPGTYQVHIGGYRVSDQQDYVVVYDTIAKGIELTYPIGAERFAPGDSVYVSWESAGYTTEPVRLEYSSDNGSSWQLIADGVNVNARQFLWHIPGDVIAPHARVRIIEPASSQTQTSDAFAIIGVPSLTMGVVQCFTYFAFDWTAVDGATDYEILISTGADWRSVATTTALNYVIAGLSRDTMYVATVRARIDDVAGRNARALSRTPSNGNCAGSISDHDFRVGTLQSPVSGRLETSKELPSNAIVRLQIGNNDDAPFSGTIPFGYQVNDGPIVSSTTGTVNIAALAGYTYTFPVRADLSAPGTYKIKAWVAHPLDPVPENDTITVFVNHVPNPEVDLTQPLVENFDDAPIQSHVTRQTGLIGLDRFDFVGSTTSGRVRTFVSSGMAYSGERAITLDVDKYIGGAGNVDSLTATFNLKNYDAATSDIRLDFQYKHHGQTPHAANRLWVRGDDQKPWLLVYNLDQPDLEPGVYVKIPSLEISDLLLANGQNFSSSFQVRWGQWGRLNAVDRESGGGYTIDDIRLYKAIDDIQMIAIDTPVLSSCGLNANAPVRVIVRNSANDPMLNIPVSYRVNGQAVVTETIPVIAGNSTIEYNFSQTANLAALGEHLLETWVGFPTDNFRENDTSRVTLRNLPVINQFPYLQDFEESNGYWFADGKNSSWELGSPNSLTIKSAASGSKAWKTTLNGNYNDREHSFLYSPCFDISGLAEPMLSFAMALDIEDCNTTMCDAAWVEYSTDGISWHQLGNVGEGTNWYNRPYTPNAAWSVQNYTNWHVASIPLPTGNNNLRIRFVMKSDPYVSREGVAIDDIHIFDLNSPIFEPAASASSRIELPVNGNNWIEFKQDNELIAAIHPNGQDMGITAVQSFHHFGEVRDTNDVLYLDRNLVIQPAQTRLNDSVEVRFYFKDREVERIRQLEGCDDCLKQVSAYRLGISQYSDLELAKENGTLEDNEGANWRWISPSEIKLVPYDSGYVAAFKTRRFSEFWLSRAPLGAMAAPSVNLASFSATKQPDNDVELAWRVASEVNMDYYEIELARGNDAFAQNNFESLTQQPSQGNTNMGNSYLYNDAEPNKTGVRYYRLKMVGVDGNITYSDVRAVVFNSEIKPLVYPNPTNGPSWLMFQANDGEIVDVVVYDINGRSLLKKNYRATGFIQKIEFDLSGIAGSGVYLVDIRTANSREVVKLVKK